MILELLNPFKIFQRKKAQIIYYAPLPYNKILATFTLREEIINIGRAQELPGNENTLAVKVGANIMIANTSISTKISRKHATLSWDAGLKKYKFEDHSKYGSKINSKCINHDDNIVLNNKDMIDIQGFRFQILYS